KFFNRRLGSRGFANLIWEASGGGQLWGKDLLRGVGFFYGGLGGFFLGFWGTAALWLKLFKKQLKDLGGRQFNKTFQIKRIAKKTTGIVSGVLVAGTVLALCVGILIGLMRFASLQQENGRLADRLLIVVIPETLYVVGIIALWRRRKSVALGILLA